MKGAIVILLILLMGRLTAQSFDVYGYTLNVKDKIYLQGIYTRIDSIQQNNIHEDDFSPYLDYFPKNTKEYMLLHEIYTYIQTQDDFIVTPEDTPSSSEYPESFIELLGRQF